MAEFGDLLLSVLSGVRVPRPGDRVHKDECAFSFDGPECENGLYICMNTFLGFGKQFVERHHRKTGQRVFLHLRRTRLPRAEEGSSGCGDPPKKKPTRLAIGVEGGFEVNSESCQFQEDVSIFILPESVSVPREALAQMAPAVCDRISASIEGILAADSASRKQEVETWDGEVRQESAQARRLEQVNRDIRILPCGWRCARCDLRDNLWLNLTDGTILCGRRYFDGTGGNNHALEHYRVTGYPLAVKLGTITPDGADVFSYAEDEMVLDPLLADHLAHFGIDMMSMQKTDKTMTELEIDMNQRLGEWETIQETGVCLKPLHGPELTGLQNLGNSCYLNSVVQVVFSVPDFQHRYVGNLQKIFQDSSADPTQDFNTQVAKLGYGLVSGEHSWGPVESEETETDSIKRQDPPGIAPRMFKALVGKGHAEFCTGRQQDAQEFFLHFLNMVERNCRTSENPNVAFRFLVEERIHCLTSGKVKYTERVDYIVQLPVPMEAAINKVELADYEKKRAEGVPLEPVRARILFEDCLAAFSEPERVDDFWSTALQAKSVAVKRTRFASFPDYLVIQVKKFTFGLDWVPRKLDVSIDMPDELDLSHLRGVGLQPGEEELPEVAPPLVTPDEGKGSGLSIAEDEDSISSALLSSPASPVLDEAVVLQLAEMGFPTEACRKAVYFTANAGVEAAMTWIMSHLDEPDFANPLALPPSAVLGADPPSEESLSTIVSMGFSREQAVRALRATNNSLERAVDWIFSHMDELDAEAAMDVSEGRSGAESVSETTPMGPRVRDGVGRYQLFAFISHMGTSTMCGHYVCHIKKAGRWVIFNDCRVCASAKPPRDLGYIYFYQRVPT